MTELTKIETADAMPVRHPFAPAEPAARIHRAPARARRRSDADRAFYELVDGLNRDPMYHTAATYASYALGVIVAGTLFMILTAVVM